MLGSLTVYRRVLRENVFAPRLASGLPDPSYKLPAAGHGMAGMLAGWTVSFIAAPVEHVKARLQVQYAADKSKRLYKGPIDCSRKIVCSCRPCILFVTPIRSKGRTRAMRRMNSS
jgi:solute carrier family 25 carnitine/acylcarnitine transporter 20/29